ncbi:hypothetical protein [Pseudaquabacterium rugosum]|uniref:Uncharacterized protein n=1 Tax=Pseudaquabacterium rugosum TaxID=2984194 RepID=A0ABU9BGI3_9BURK
MKVKEVLKHLSSLDSELELIFVLDQSGAEPVPSNPKNFCLHLTANGPPSKEYVLINKTEDGIKYVEAATESECGKHVVEFTLQY